MASSTSFRSPCENPASQQKQRSIPRHRDRGRHTRTCRAEWQQCGQVQGAKRAKQLCSMLVARSGTDLWPLMPAASPGEQARTTKTVITTTQHVHVTSSRKPKTHFECTRLFAHAPLHTRTLTQTQIRSGTATQIAFALPKRKPLLGLLEVAGGEEEDIHVACSLA